MKQKVITFFKKYLIYIIGLLISVNLAYSFLTDNGQTEMQKNIIETLEE